MDLYLQWLCIIKRVQNEFYPMQSQIFLFQTYEEVERKCSPINEIKSRKKIPRMQSLRADLRQNRVSFAGKLKGSSGSIIWGWRWHLELSNWEREKGSFLCSDPRYLSSRVTRIDSTGAPQYLRWFWVPKAIEYSRDNFWVDQGTALTV